MKCSISNIANVISESIPNPAESGFDIFVGLEHYDSGEVKITRYGSTQNLVTAVKVFRKGDILLARRNVYLKRAGLVDFDGVTSGDSIVLRVKDNLSSLTLQSEDIRMYLPFVLNTEEFWNYAEKYSDGTMSKRLSPKTLLQYEFDIPDDVTEKNRLLWQAYKTKESYKAMILATDEMVKSQFIEMFGGSDYPKYPLGNLCKILAGKTLPFDVENEGGPIAYIKVADMNLPENDRVVTTSTRNVTEETAIISGILPIGATVFPKNGAAALHNKKRITAITTCVDMNTMGVYSTSDALDPEFLYAFLVHQDVASLTLTGAIPQIRPKDIAALEIPLPPLERQRGYIRMVGQADKSKYLS